MANTTSDALFRLIKSMTKAEKRYFKLFAYRQKSAEDAKFIKLFDCIDRQKEYDELKILHKEPSFKSEQLSNMKAHLYKQVLECLRFFNSSNDIEIKIRKIIDQTIVLYNKCLYEQCSKSLEKAKFLAVTYDKPVLLLDILEQEKKIVLKFIKSNIDEKVNEIIKQTEEVYNKLHRLNSFTNLATKLYSFYLKVGFIRNNKDFEIANSFLYSNLPTFKEEELSFSEKMYLYYSFVGYYYVCQDFEKGCDFATKWVNLFDDNPEMIVSVPEMYIKAVNNLLVAEFKLGRYNDFIRSMEKFDKIKNLRDLNLTDNIQLLLFKYTSAHQFNKYFLLGEFTKGSKIVDGLEKDLEKFADRLDRHYLLILYYKMACMYIGCNNYSKAVHWLNKVINAKDENIRSDIQCFARILNLICHNELGNSALADYYVKSTYRFLLKKDDMHLFQSAIMRFLKKLSKISSNKELVNAYAELKEQLLPLENNTYEKRAFVYFDVISWLESKIENRTVEEIIREKAIKKIEDSNT
ncbi:MAG: hypothetical protein PHD97_11495 [Bacteroidales bacterium]|nr:hypothetical protein [Bacteroidales bacterium]